MSRIRIRETNLNDEELKKKYFSETFNLKEFVFQLFDSFFPNVSWRYIGAGHFAHRIALQLTEYLFQLGLWTYEDHQRLVKTLLEKSENLIKLEDSCIKDAQANRVRGAFLKELDQLFGDIKEYMSLIIIHTIMLVNDKSLSESLSWTRTNKGIFSQTEGLWENAYHKDRELNNLLNNILMRYLMRDSSFTAGGNSYTFVKSSTKDTINDIFLMISDINYDVYEISKNLVGNKLMNFITHNYANRD